jgi:hypothetical protein
MIMSILMMRYTLLYTQQRAHTSVLSAQSSMSSTINNAPASSTTAANSSAGTSNKLQDIQGCARLWRLLQECYTNTGGKQHAHMYASKATAAEGEFQVRMYQPVAWLLYIYFYVTAPACVPTSTGNVGVPMLVQSIRVRCIQVVVVIVMIVQLKRAVVPCSRHV